MEFYVHVSRMQGSVEVETFYKEIETRIILKSKISTDGNLLDG